MAKERKPAKEKSLTMVPQDLSEARSMIQTMQRALDIEAALDKVRSRTMSMYKSEEVADAAAEIFIQLEKLGVKPSESAFILIDSFSESGDLWMTDLNGNVLPNFGKISSFKGEPYFENILASWKNKQSFYRYTLGGQELINHDRWAKQNTTIPLEEDYHQSSVARAPKLTFFVAYFSYGYLLIASPEPYSAEEESIIIRFAKVFEQTYTRFLDLKKAEEQAKEVKIEAALERIRGRAMAMKKSEELPDVALSFLEQVDNLAIPVLGVALSVVNTIDDTFVCYLADNTDDPARRKLLQSGVLQVGNFWLSRETVQRQKSGEQEFTMEAGGKKIEEWIDFIAEAFSEERAQRLRSAKLKRLYAHTVEFYDTSNIMFSSTAPLHDEQRLIIRRLVDAFRMAYLRFLDLKKAEAQAREAQIEAALERIRSRSLAMHDSKELSEVSTVLFKELFEFCDDIKSSGIVLCDREIPEQWMCSFDVKMLPPVHIPQDIDQTIRNLYRAWETQQELFIETLSKEEARKHGERMMSLPEIKSIFEQVPPSQIVHPEAQTNYAATFTQGYLLVITEYPVEGLSILPRFAKVFEQVYTRFLDLKKAEEQAREAEIQLALERVRARTMAMHQSSELSEAVKMINEQIRQLGIEADANWFWFIGPDLNSIEFWVYYEDRAANKVMVSGDDVWTFREEVDAWKDNIPFLQIPVPTDEFRQIQKKFFGIEIGKIEGANYFNLLQVRHAYGFLGLGTWIELREEEIAIARRFAKVFEQTYTRFLDLQKAEKQAREAEIQLALERVRARTMAMHKSEELTEAASVLFQQILALGLSPVACAFIIVDEKSNTGEVYISADGTVIPNSFVLPYYGEPAQDQILESWKNRAPYLIVDLKGKQLEKHLRFIASNMPVDEMLEASGEAQPDRLALHIINFRYGFLGINFLEPNEESIPILLRFAIVFEQTFTRFLDLQKAEVQAREAQIEAALERVRARSMAMHHSDDLTDVATILHKELINLEIPEFYEANIVVIDEQNSRQSVWSGQTLEMIELPLLGDHVLDNIYENWQRKEAFFSKCVSGVELQNHVNFVIPESDRSEALEVALEGMPDPTFFNCAFFSNGYLELITNKEPSTSSSTILIRFAKVFEQTYTRFLDLQKAEEQAREAQIETAMERIRSRSLAMQSSEDLVVVSDVLRQQMRDLGIEDIESLVIVTYDLEKNIFNAHYVYRHPDDMTGPLRNGIGKFDWDGTYRLRLDKEKYFSDESDYTIKGDFEMLKEWYHHMEEHSPNSVDHDKHGNLLVPDYLYYNYSKFKGGALLLITSEEAPEYSKYILKKAAGVFEQTYTRFIDLKKAEQQARESQIETALERIRSASMAMHQSDELPKVAQVLVEQLEHLQVQQLGSSILEIEDERELYNQYSAHDNLKDGGKYLNIIRDYPLTPLFLGREILRRTRAQEKDFTIELRGENLQEWMHYVREYIHESRGNAMLKAGFECIYFHFAVFHGSSCVVITTLVPLPDEDRKILRKMANTFGLSYQRYLDLVRAEEQTHEAQIEAALERVRAASMAMHKSEELPGVAEVFLIQFEQLAIPAFGAGICVLDKIKETGINYFVDNSQHGAQTVLSISRELSTDVVWISDEALQLIKKGQTEFSLVGTGKKIDQWIEYVKREISPKRAKRLKEAGIERIYFHFLVFHQYSFIIFSSLEPLEEKHWTIMRRMTKTFSSSFQRFLDLQHSEAQAQEARIEAALERVRSASMAMHQSEELPEVARVFLTQIESFGIPVIGAGINIVDLNTMMGTTYFVDNSLDKDHTELLTTRAMHLDRWWLSREATKQMEAGREEFTVTATGQKLIQWINWVEEEMNPARAQRIKAAGIKKVHFHFLVFHELSNIIFSSLMPLTEEHWLVMRRLCNTFGMAYRRFLDLKKVELQAREAQIEAALERVRAAAMAMHHSSGLVNVVSVTYQQIRKLDIPSDMCAIILHKDGTNDLFMWIASPEQTYQEELHVPYFDHVLFEQLREGFSRDVEHFPLYLNKTQVKSWYQHVLKYTIVGELVNEDRRKRLLSGPHHTGIATNKKHHGLMIFNFNEYQYNPSDISTFLRFSRVFEQAYVRFLDLKKAETQAREAEVQTALERIRASALAMHTSDGLSQVAAVLREQLALLGQNELESCLVQLYEKGQDTYQAYYSFKMPHDPEEKIVHDVAIVPWKETKWSSSVIRKYLSGKSSFKIHADHEMLTEWYGMLARVSPLTVETDETGSLIVPQVLHYYFSTFKGGFLSVVSYEEPSEETQNLLDRAASTFNIAYRRYQDLLQAEAQARESRVEAALERIRSASLAMQNSSELSQVALVLFKQLEELFGDSIEGCGIHLPLKNDDYKTWTANYGEGDSIKVRVWEVQQLEIWLTKESQRLIDQGINDFSIELTGKYLKEWLDLESINDVSAASRWKKLKPDKIYHHVAVCDKRLTISLSSMENWNDGQRTILRRIVNVFYQAFQRFEDLMLVEARENEAIKQASLDRVRAEIASMRTKEDLNRITPLIWKELIALDVPFIRCGVFIIDELQEEVQVFLTTPAGKALTAMKLPFDANKLTMDSIEYWRKNEVYNTHWTKQDFVHWMRSLLDAGRIQDQSSYLGAAEPPASLFLYYIPFRQGMLYVGNTESLPDEKIALVQTLARAFEIAYARYEDFKRLENTLNDLKATQAQLIQSEKMASLGELTAGIAHEIQNPLNFVNNFSELNIELLQELDDEIKNQDYEEIAIIAKSIMENEGKILFHGKRADGIVRSMLDHSRTNSGKKEMVDLNMMADEYLRLAYHGFRAKDKSFNVNFKTDLDPEVPPLSVIPQDMGRVFLNLITNAFQTCTERNIVGNKNKNPNGGIEHDGVPETYKPLVTVSTKKLVNHIEISVSDNGLGIPEHIKDKIFQPFFTTKPAGSGTGLGLSLTYDIIKALGGRIMLESTPGIGANFIIELPINVELPINNE